MQIFSIMPPISEKCMPQLCYNWVAMARYKNGCSSYLVS